MTIKSTVTDGIGTLTLASPPLNILTRGLMASLRQELAALAEQSDLRVLLLSAEGKHFSAGADVGEHMPPEYRELIPEFIDTILALSDFPLPTIAAVRGRCLGGGFELAQAVDMVLAGEGAMFGQPEIMLGVSPPAACALLPELCAPGLAAELVLTGDPITAQQAYGAGLVRQVVPDDQVEDAASALAQRLSRHSAAALRLTKRQLQVGLASRRAESLRAAAQIYIDELMETADAVEGLQAFLDKRKPTWTHA
jgi:cyclohexa-1,5-dienecarbonyl-CoA hydratase